MIKLDKIRNMTLKDFNFLYLFYPAAIFYMEIIVKMACFNETALFSLVYTGLFSISIGLFFAFLLSVFSNHHIKIASIVLLALITLFACAQLIYFYVFQTFGTLYSLFYGGDAITKFWGATLTGIRGSFLYLILLFLPMLALILMEKWLFQERHSSDNALFNVGFCAISAHLIAFILIMSNTQGIMPVSYQYKSAFVPNLSVSNFGVLTTLRLDAKHLLFGQNLNDESMEETNKSPEPVEDDEDDEIEYGYNISDIDFDELIANEKNSTVKDMHEYFKNISPTKQNEYTGMFEGKNLVWFVGEAFSSLALNESFTPTLDRLSKEGFVFNNFYNPIWNVSTSDGEYVTLTGLIPKSGIWSFKRSSKNYMPYGFGNMLSTLGYTCKAYHNHYYNYYSRDLSHPNLGYDYKGLGNGLKIMETWPESDLEMLQVTIPQYIQNPPFHTYYMTVSGHLNYTFYGNYIAKKHKSKVEHLPYSEGCLAYLACNIDLDLAVSHLIDELRAAGELENTVIVLSGDHYPYGLNDDEMDELAGYELEKKFEKFKSTLIIWSGDMEEPIEIDKVCSSLDVMPTLANLMGLNYDSRLISGQDILSESPGLVEFNDRSFVTDFGRYDASKNTFIPNPGNDLGDDYARNILNRVNKEFEYSAKILEYDYYSRINGTT